MRVQVRYLDDTVLAGTSELSSFTNSGYGLVPDGSELPVAIPIASIKYVQLPGPLAPGGSEDPRAARNLPKVSVRCVDGETIRTYKDDSFGQDQGCLRMLRWDGSAGTFERLLIPLQTLKGVFFVNDFEPTPAEVARQNRPAGPGSPDAAVKAVASRLRQRLADLADRDLASRDRAIFSAAVERHLDRLMALEEVDAKPQLRQVLLERLVSDALGHGPIDALLADPSVTEIMINGPDQVYVERHGKVELATVTFEDEAQLLNVVQRIVARTGRRLNESTPMVDARLPDGSRINAIMPPAAPRGAAVTIRKFRAHKWTLADLVKTGTVSKSMADALAMAVAGRCNILVSGGTGSGKTTLLSALAGQIPTDQRVISIEDTLELQTDHPHLVPLECRPANVEGRGELAVRDLLRNALRMRPDRILIGEVRGGEAYDMIQALNTGHDGGMSTLHANSPRDAMLRLEAMAMGGAPSLPPDAVRAQIGSAVDIIVHIARMSDGRRKVTRISELAGFGSDGPIVRDIYLLEARPDGGLQVRATGVIPKSLEKLRLNGVQLPSEMLGKMRPQVVAASA